MGEKAPPERPTRGNDVVETGFSAADASVVMPVEPNLSPLSVQSAAEMTHTVDRGEQVRKMSYRTRSGRRRATLKNKTLMYFLHPIFLVLPTAGQLRWTKLPQSQYLVRRVYLFMAWFSLYDVLQSSKRCCTIIAL